MFNIPTLNKLLMDYTSRKCEIEIKIVPPATISGHVKITECSSNRSPPKIFAIYAAV